VGALEELLKDFVAAVREENKVLKQLAEIAQEKQDLIISNKIKELDSLIRKEGIMVSSLDKLEDARFKLQEKLALKWGIKTGDLSAGVIIERAGREFPGVFAEVKEEIDNLNYNVTRLRIMNDHNNELISHSLDYIETVQSIINGDRPGIYSDRSMQSKGISAVQRANLLDKKI